MLLPVAAVLLLCQLSSAVSPVHISAPVEPACSYPYPAVSEAVDRCLFSRTALPDDADHRTRCRAADEVVACALETLATVRPWVQCDPQNFRHLVQTCQLQQPSVESAYDVSLRVCSDYTYNEMMEMRLFPCRLTDCMDQCANIPNGDGSYSAKCYNSSSCPDLDCSGSCSVAGADPETGCPTCDCRCEEMNCEQQCFDGYRTDMNGCRTCECQSGLPGDSCPTVMCTDTCDYYKRDSRDCMQCGCQCEPQCCTNECEFGFMKMNGCPTCQCNDPPVNNTSAPPTIDCPSDALLHCPADCSTELYTDSDGCERCRCKIIDELEDCLARMTCLQGCEVAMGDSGCYCHCQKECSVEDTHCDNKNCEYGPYYREDPVCGFVCECQKEPAPGCYPAMCPMDDCTPRYWTDDSGCLQCGCREECSEMMCPMDCETELYENERGCEMCRCKTTSSARDCPPLDCDTPCNIYGRDDYDCATCECVELTHPDHCDSVNCDSLCDHGHVFTRDQCPTCDCKPHPCSTMNCPEPMLCELSYSHSYCDMFGTTRAPCATCVSPVEPATSSPSGQTTTQSVSGAPAQQMRCPEPSGFGTCIEQCSDSEPCEEGLWCCSNGCGHTCQQPEPIDEIKETTTSAVGPQGKCPPLEGSVLGICLHECDVEDPNACDDGMMCCSNGCGSVCTLPLTPSEKPMTTEQTRTTTDDDSAGPAEQMRCPQPSGFGTCVEQCSESEPCEEGLWCCSNGCGHTCQQPEPIGEVKRTTTQSTTEGLSGQAQCPVVEQGVMGVCLQSCDPADHGTCGQGEMCCSTGCGYVCKQPVLPEKSTTTAVGGASSERCPKVLDGLMGSCLEECSSDEMCSGELICCSNGCGHTCQQPIEPKPTDPIGGQGGSTESTTTITTEKRCPLCARYCEFGSKMETDEQGCSTCECFEDPCLGEPCAEDEVCEVENVQCVSEPCPPVRVCKKASTTMATSSTTETTSETSTEMRCLLCSRRCMFGSKMETDENGCPTCECFEDPCLSATCAENELCEVELVECATGPCPPRHTCKAPESTTTVTVEFNPCTDRRGGGDPLPDVFCGRGPGRQDCPSSHECVIHETDRYAVCCPKVEVTTPDMQHPCEFGDPLEDIFCGNGPASQDCPQTHMCVSDALDRGGFCCPLQSTPVTETTTTETTTEKDCVVCFINCDFGMPDGDDGCPLCQCNPHPCETMDCVEGSMCVLSETEGRYPTARCLAEQEMREICSLPMETGSECREIAPRYAYNTQTHACERFVYTGCQGNDNNFLSHFVCEHNCLSLFSTAEPRTTKQTTPEPECRCPTDMCRSRCQLYPWAECRVETSTDCVCSASWFIDEILPVDCNQHETLCEQKARRALFEKDSVTPTCDVQKGTFSPVQCSRDECWCVNHLGIEITDSRKPNQPGVTPVCDEYVTSQADFRLSFEAEFDHVIVDETDRLVFEADLQSSLSRQFMISREQIVELRASSEEKLTVHFTLKKSVATQQQRHHDLAAIAHIINRQIESGSFSVQWRERSLRVVSVSHSLSAAVVTEQSPQYEQSSSTSSFALAVSVGVVGVVLLLLIVAVIVLLMHRRNSSGRHSLCSTASSNTASLDFAPPPTYEDQKDMEAVESDLPEKREIPGDKYTSLRNSTSIA